MPRKALIKIRRGTETQLPALDVGELGFCTDTNKLYIGTPTGNQLLVAAQSVGDMLKSIYDTNNDGIVDNADKLDGKHASSFVLKTGDTMTGPLALTGGIFDTEFKADSWNLINKYTSGGWARGLLNVKNKDGTNYIQIGGYGSGQNFTRLYIGKAWDDWLLGINPNNNTVEIQGNLTKNNKEVATKDEIPTKVSQLENDRGYVTQEELGDAGYGDMLKSIYDTDNDGKVDAAEAADSVPWTGVTGKPSTFPPSSHTHTISNITGLQAALDGKMSVGPLTWNDLKGVV